MFETLFFNHNIVTVGNTDSTQGHPLCCSCLIFKSSFVVHSGGTSTSALYQVRHMCRSLFHYICVFNK